MIPKKMNPEPLKNKEGYWIKKSFQKSDVNSAVEFYKNYVNDPIKYFKKHPEQLNEFWEFCDVDKRIMIIQETEIYMTHFNIFLLDKAFPDLKK